MCGHLNPALLCGGTFSVNSKHSEAKPKQKIWRCEDISKALIEHYNKTKEQRKCWINPNLTVEDLVENPCRVVSLGRISQPDGLLNDVMNRPITFSTYSGWIVKAMYEWYMITSDTRSQAEFWLKRYDLDKNLSNDDLFLLSWMEVELPEWCWRPRILSERRIVDVNLTECDGLRVLESIAAYRKG